MSLPRHLKGSAKLASGARVHHNGVSDGCRRPWLGKSCYSSIAKRRPLVIDFGHLNPGAAMLHGSRMTKLIVAGGGFLLFALLLSSTGGSTQRGPGVPQGVELTSSASMHVYEDGAVIDAMSVRGTIYVHGDNVTIRNTLVEAPAWFGIRVMDGSTGLRIEDTTVECTGAQGWGVAFDHYSAERVSVKGCFQAFAHLDREHVRVTDSEIDGQPFEHGGLGEGPSTRIPKDDVGVPQGVELTSSASMHVYEDGAVIDAMSVRGTIYVHGDNVTIRNTLVEAPAWFGIRVMDGSTGLRIEDTTVECTGAQGWGVAFDHYSAERVSVKGCFQAFAHLDREHVSVADSAVNGFLFYKQVAPGVPSDSDAAVPGRPPSTSVPSTTLSTAPTTSSSTTSTTTTTAPAAGVGEFVRRVDVGPQASTYGHTPVGELKPWTGGSTITDSSKPRDPDGVMRFRGYRFIGPINLATKDVAFIDSEFVMPPLTSKVNGVLYSSSTMPAGSLLIDHCRFDAGMTGYTLAALNVYQPIRATVRYSLFEGSADGIRAATDGLYEHNYISMNGQGEVVQPGHIDGIHGEYYKVNWTARHNTIIGGVQPTAAAIDAGATVRPERGNNAAIYAPAVLSPSYGVVAEDNYIDGFNQGISLSGTAASNPHIVRNNTFGKNFRWYPSLRIRTFDQYPYTVVQNNHFDRLFNEATGNTTPG